MVAVRPKISLAPSDLDQLITGLDVGVWDLAELSVCNAADFDPSERATMYVWTRGHGRITIDDQSYALRRPVMAIVPPRRRCRIETDSDWPSDGDPIRLDCQAHRSLGFIRAAVSAGYSRSFDLLSSCHCPIVEDYDDGHSFALSLQAAVDGLQADEVGTAAMARALFKQILIVLLRQSAASVETWRQRFPALSDPQVLRALSLMIAKPGADHTIRALAQSAGLSRSAFMLRFASSINTSPLSFLRDLRMHQAATLLATGVFTIERVANLVGYDSRSSFSRAFRTVYDIDPSSYRPDAPGVSADWHNGARGCAQCQTNRGVISDDRRLDSDPVCVEDS